MKTTMTSEERTSIDTRLFLSGLLAKEEATREEEKESEVKTKKRSDLKRYSFSLHLRKMNKEMINFLSC